MDGFAADPALRDHWYVVASAAQSTPTAVGLLGRAYVIWRDHDGVIRAAVDRCPHREAPLSAGTLVEGQLECAYHGWRFTGGGTCAAVPSSGPDGPVPPAARLDIVAAAERYGLVWVCPGDPSAPIPEMRWDDDDRFRRINTEVDVWRTSATRMTDNFLDIAHFPWVHTRTFGGGQATEVPRYALGDLDDGWFGYAYEVEARNPPDAVATTIATEPVVRRWMSTGFRLPFTVRSTIRYADGLEHVLLLATTPIDDTTSYFSFVVWRNDDPATDPQAAVAFDRAIGAEDKAMLERIDGVLPLDPAAVVNVRADTASVEWRRRLSALLDGHPDGGSP